MWDNQWHMIAGTYDGSTVRFYVDGNQIGTGTPVPGGGFAPLTYGSHPGHFGMDGYTGDLNCRDRTFSGGVDELRVYDSALTPGELQRLASAPGPTPPDLVPDRPTVAAFKVNPNPTCTGVPTRFDASASSSDPSDPITDYGYSYTGQGGDGAFDAGNSAISNHMFDWDVLGVNQPGSGAVVLNNQTFGISFPSAVFDKQVTLTVTTARGQVATSAPVNLTFAQQTSTDSRAACPSGPTPLFPPATLDSLSSSSQFVTVTSTCRSLFTSCEGAGAVVLPDFSFFGSPV